MHFIVNGYTSVHPSAMLTLNTWSHVVGTYDGMAIRLYVNGELRSEVPYSAPLVHSQAPLRISTAESFNWVGDVDEVAIYSRALTQEEIAAHFRLGDWVLRFLPTSRTGDS